MKIPKQLKICGLDYKVILDDDFATKKSFAGEHEPNRLLITLHQGDYNKQKIEQCFIHEIIHAINTHYCGDDELSEDQTEHIANGIYQVLKDNDLLK